MMSQLSDELQFYANEMAKNRKELAKRMVQKLENEVTEGEKPKNPPSPKSRLAVLKRNKKPAAGSDPFRFQGQGVFYKGKLIGERDVPAARGDDICAEAMRTAKAAVKAAGAHKTRIQLQINIEGIKILDEKSNAVLHNFPVSRISFVARDTTDARAFGLVFGDAQSNKYRFYGIKTAQTADQAVLAIRDMFQVVFEMKKKQIEQVKQQQQQENPTENAGSDVAVADLLDLETELSMIEQGVQQLQQIPTTDAFGQTPFADPFADSFASNNSSVLTTSLNNCSLSTTTTSPFVIPPPNTPQQQPSGITAVGPSPQFAAFSPPTQMAPVPQPLQATWQAQPAFHLAPPAPMMLQQHHSQPTLNAFSFQETNPFASVAFAAPPQPAPIMAADPFALPPRPAPAPPTTAPAMRPTIDWGVNENVAPQMHHANTFAAFDSLLNFSNTQNSHNWEESAKRVTSLEDAFSKLVDMDDLVGPTETKKNPFEHILNPPKASLNSLTTMRPMPAGVAAAPSDPFGDDFFR